MAQMQEGRTGTETVTHQRALPTQADFVATLVDLLTRFRDSGDLSDEQIARFASAGAEALMTEMQSRPWLSSAEGAAILGMSEAEIQTKAQQQAIPAVRTADGQTRLHRRDVSLIRMSQRLGATEGQWTPLTTPIAWSSELSDRGFDPWDGITPG
jgi:hypothetical protein